LASTKIAVIGVMANSLPDTGTWEKLQQKNLDDVLQAAQAAKGGS